MTCIIGFVCPKSNKVFIGGDSAGCAGHSIVIRSDEKVFRNGSTLMGFTTSFRMGQILRYDFVPPEHPEDFSPMKYMVSKFIPEVRKSLKDGAFTNVKDSVEHGGCFLVGYLGNLYCIENDFQVGMVKDNIIAIGCGEDHALGAMYALEHLYPKERIQKALEITTHLNSGVRPPFVIEEL